MRLKTHQGEVRSFEFVTSTFGGRLPKQPFRIVQATVADACIPFSESVRAKLMSMEKSLPVKSVIAMVVTRGNRPSVSKPCSPHNNKLCHFPNPKITVMEGNCQFDIKAMHVQEAGGSLMIVVGEE